MKNKKAEKDAVQGVRGGGNSLTPLPIALRTTPSVRDLSSAL